MSRRAGSPLGELGAEKGERRAICVTTRPDDHVPRRLPRLQIAAPDFTQAPPQTIAGHRGFSETGNDDPGPRVALCVRPPGNVEMAHAHPASRFPTVRQICAARQSRTRRVPLGRQRLRCFEGSLTVRRLRPFLRRRDNVARPHLVLMRARNPCLLMRRRLRGRYVGFPIVSSCKAGKPTRRAMAVQG